MLEILFEDDNLVAFDKPSGISVLRDRSGETNFLETVRQKFPDAHLVHRLDKFTSGVLVMAKNRHSQRSISHSFESRSVTKYYVCVVAGHFPSGSTLSINLPLKSGRKSRFRVAGLREEIRTSQNGWYIESSDGKECLTRVRSVHHGPVRSFLVCQPKTGRTHQIRVHLAWIGHAVVGDHLYGSKESKEQSWPRLALHAHKLRLPMLEEAIVSPVPEDVLAAVSFKPTTER